MKKDSIQKLMDEIENYKQAIQDAQDALDAAERELEETIEYEYEKEHVPQLTIMK